MSMQRILLPIDGSAAAEAAARFAEDIARSEDKTVLVLGVAVDLDEGSDPTEVERAVLNFMHDRVAEEAARIREAGVQADELVVAADNAEHGILQVAREREADVIVMGTHGTTGWRRAAIGSVSDAVVRQSAIPVVLVPLREED